MPGDELAVLLSGIGGQGIVFAGRLLARALFSQGRQVALRYAYGAEVMGTPVHSEIVASHRTLLCPYIEKADAVAILHPSAAGEALEKLKPGALLILDEVVPPPPVPPGTRVEARPFVTATASGRAGDPGRYAPIAALGFLAKLGQVDWEALLAAAQGEPGTKENEAALRTGYGM